MAELPSYRTLDVAVRGGTLRAGIWGPQDPGTPTVLAIHGITASHRCWTLLAEQLPGVRIIAPDLRGRGRSNALPAPYGMASHAEDMAALLDAAGVEKAVVLGHSMGAFVAVVTAHRSADRVASLLLVDGGLPLPVPEGVSVDIKSTLGPAAERLTRTFPSEAAYLDFWRGHPALAQDWSAELEDYLLYDLVGTAPELRPSAGFPAVAEDSVDVFGGPSVMAALDGLAHDTELLWVPRGLMNESTGLYSQEAVQQWTDRLPALRAELVPDFNHYTIVMSAAGSSRVAASLLDSLAEAAGTAG